MTVTASSRWIVVVALALSLGLVASGCYTRDYLKQNHDRVAGVLAEAEQMGAKICAPIEYASAEAHLAFALEEWEERDYQKSKEHLDIADDRALDAKRLSLNCIETTPPDSDGDGLLDNVDACPDQPEDVDGFQDTDGCPDTDNDGDGIADADDQCPNEPETFNGVDDEDGCPDASYKKVEVTDEQILLKEKIHFETGKSTIQIDSYGILEEVVQVMKDNPKMRIRIEGHTDSVGRLDYNMGLSRDRALSVMQFIAGRGIDTGRLIAEGFGPNRPVAPNNTATGRAKNRRVEIHIVDR